MRKNEIEFTVHLSNIKNDRILTLQDAYALAPAYNISRLTANRVYTIVEGISTQGFSISLTNI